MERDIFELQRAVLTLTELLDRASKIIESLQNRVKKLEDNHSLDQKLR